MIGVGWKRSQNSVSLQVRVDHPSCHRKRWRWWAWSNLTWRWLGWQEERVSEQMQEILFTSLEYAYYAGFLPLRFLQVRRDSPLLFVTSIHSTMSFFPHSIIFCILMSSDAGFWWFLCSAIRLWVFVPKRCIPVSTNCINNLSYWAIGRVSHLKLSRQRKSRNGNSNGSMGRERLLCIEGKHLLRRAGRISLARIPLFLLCCM